MDKLFYKIIHRQIEGTNNIEALRNLIIRKVLLKEKDACTFIETKDEK